MITIKGIAASPGVAIGPAFILTPDTAIFEKKKIPAANVQGEVRRYQEAIERTLEDLNKTEASAQELFGAAYAKLLKAHKLILKDPMISQGVPARIEKDMINAEYALYTAVQEITAKFEAIKDEFFRERRFDIADVAKRLFENLTLKKQNKFAAIKEPSIVIAHNLYPYDTINLKGKKVLGFATDVGGKTSHTALLAQSMQMPAVVGLSTAAEKIKNGDIVIVDGENGLLVINPTPEAMEAYKKEQGKIKKVEHSLKDINDLPNITKDGHRVSLYVNYDPRRDFKEMDIFTSEGLGLLRTEFLYMDRFDPPSEEEQVAVYKKAASRFDVRPFTVRLADLGGDKISQLGLARSQEEDNPFMGNRGIRLFLKYPNLMLTQMRAIVKTAAEVDAKVKLMMPMISSVEEVVQVKKYFKTVLAELSAQRITPKNPIDLGVMIEVPSAALSLDGILPQVDFVSIGTNDLIQYLLAVDRTNQEVADLYDAYHPAVLRTINFVVQAARKKGKTVSICGEMASDPEMVPFLVGIGVDILSVSPRMFLRIKNTLRNLNFKDCSNLAQAAILLSSSADIKKLKEYYKTDEENT
ncbi:MAG: phosphoenolpyruvate--protein phosphotransferase [Elusimicrobiota bacterium]|jgi:phosphotransferase system enzyme I (PtsI)|nr:phosphoenolpyruvate--protein phosphotransferase [Elusimicrobiota bacterium]